MEDDPCMKKIHNLSNVANFPIKKLLNDEIWKLRFLHQKTKAGFVKAEQDKIRRTQISMLEEQSLGVVVLVGIFVVETSGRLGSEETIHDSDFCSSLLKDLECRSLKNLLK